MRMRANPLMSACIVCFVLTELKFFSICLSCVSYFFAVVHGIDANLRDFLFFPQRGIKIPQQEQPYLNYGTTSQAQ